MPIALASRSGGVAFVEVLHFSSKFGFGDPFGESGESRRELILWFLLDHRVLPQFVKQFLCNCQWHSLPEAVGEDLFQGNTVVASFGEDYSCWETIEQELSAWDVSSELARLRLTSSHVDEFTDVDMEVQSGTKTCKRCKSSFATESSSSSACRFHPTYFVSRRHDDQKRYYELGPDDPPYAAKFWDCCGSEDPEAEGCKTSFHFSYDEG